MPLFIIIVSNHELGLLTRFLFSDFVVQSQLKDGYQKYEMCIMFRSKVLIFFIAKHNHNLISPTKSTQYEGINLIMVLIGNVNSQHPITFF